MFKKHLENHKAFNTCGNCGFTWLPMSERFRHDCPKCSPKGNSMKVETDEDYLRNELKVNENVSNEMITYSEPRLTA